VDGTYDHIQRYACQGNGTCNETDKGRVVATIYMANFGWSEVPKHQSSQGERNDREDHHCLNVTGHPRIAGVKSRDCRRTRYYKNPCLLYKVQPNAMNKPRSKALFSKINVSRNRQSSIGPTHAFFVVYF